MLNTLGGHMEVIKKRVNKFGTRSVKQISPKLLTLISPKMFTLISPRTASYPDLMAKYENPLEDACSVREGQSWIAHGWNRPEGFCLSAWETISPFVLTLSCGGKDIYDGWMKDPATAMISCNDGFRPVSFLLEAIDEDSE